MWQQFCVARYQTRVRCACVRQWHNTHTNRADSTWVRRGFSVQFVQQPAIDLHANQLHRLQTNHSYWIFIAATEGCPIMLSAERHSTFIVEHFVKRGEFRRGEFKSLMTKFFFHRYSRYNQDKLLSFTDS